MKFFVATVAKLSNLMTFKCNYLVMNTPTYTSLTETVDILRMHSFTLVCAFFGAAYTILKKERNRIRCLHITVYIPRP